MRQMANHNEAHSSLVRELRLTLGNLPDLVLWPNQSGVAQYGQARVKYGLAKGSSDLIGILSPSGRFVALEAKTGDAVTTAEQKLFVALVRKMGGFACVVRSKEEGLAAIERAREGQCE